MIPIVVYMLIEIGVYVVSGIKANVTIYKTHFEFNQNRFGGLNYNIKYTGIERIESSTVHGTSILSVYFKEPLTEASFTEFQNNNMLAPITRIISRKSCNRYRMEITTSQFSKDAYEKICEELIRRTSVLNKAEALAKPAEGA